MAKYTLNIGLANPFTGEDNTIPETLTKAFEYLSDIEIAWESQDTKWEEIQWGDWAIETENTIKVEA